MGNVTVTKCSDYCETNLEAALNEVANNPDFPDVRNKTILLKPNILSDSRPENCITTHPEFVRQTIKLLKKLGAKEIYVGDSPGLHNSSFCAKGCGIFQVCQQEGAIWNDFSKNPVLTKIKGTNRKVPMASKAFEVDLVFSLAKFKTHQLMYTTGCTKNMFGTIVGTNKSSCHLSNPSRESFAHLIVGLCQTVKPDFCIMDAVIGMEGPGPANGHPRHVGLVIGAKSPYEADYAQAIIMGYKPECIPVLNEANRQHLISDNIVFTDLNPSDIVIKDFKRIEIQQKTHFFTSLILPFITRNLQKKKQKKNAAPDFNKDMCIKCKKCINICPAKALSLQDNVICIDKEKCIRCYCCHEMCPANAISIKG